MVKSAYMVWLQFHDLPEGHRECLRCAGKTLPHAGRAWEHIASYPHAAANLQGLLERIRLGPTEEPSNFGFASPRTICVSLLHGKGKEWTERGAKEKKSRPLPMTSAV